MRHVYFGIENLALNDAQRAQLVQALRALGPASHPSPACLCHWRTWMQSGDECRAYLALHRDLWEGEP